MRQAIRYSVILLLAVIPIAAQAALDTGNIVDWLRNIQSNLEPVVKLIVAMSYVVGAWFIVLSIMKLKGLAQSTIFSGSHGSAIGPLVYFTVGVALFYFPTIVDMTIQTVWTYGAQDVPGSYDIEGAGLHLEDVLNPLIGIVRVIGYIAFLRGWIMLARLGHQGGAQPGTISKAFIHILGGVMAINAVGTWNMLYNTIQHAAS